MTRRQAERVLEAFGAALGLKTLRLNAKGLAALRIGTTAVCFEYDAAKQTLICRALVYRFEDQPQPKVLERVLRKGPRLEYLAPAQALFVSARVTSERPLEALVRKLVTEAVAWTTQKLSASN